MVGLPEVESGLQMETDFKSAASTYFAIGPQTMSFIVAHHNFQSKFLKSVQQEKNLDWRTLIGAYLKETFSAPISCTQESHYNINKEQPNSSVFMLQHLSCLTIS